METAYAGTSLPNGVTLWLAEQPGKPMRQERIMGTYQPIDPDFWREWVAENPQSSLLTERVVWGAVNVDIIVYEAEPIAATEAEAEHG